jgi:hypothetical protein
VKIKLPYFVTQPFVVVALCGLGIIAWYWPAHIQESWVRMDSIARLLAKVFPPIEAYVSKSSFPAATSAYMALAFLLMPVHFYFSYMELKGGVEESWHAKLWSIQSVGDVYRRLLLVIVVVALAIFALFLNPGYDFNLLPINTSRTALAWGGWLVSGAAPAWCLSWALCNLIVLSKHFSGRN